VVLGLGLDLLEIGRVDKELSRGEWLLADGIFSAEEIAHCSSTEKPALHYAACFAAKEAILKALGIPVGDLSMFREVEVMPGGDGVYRAVLSSRLKVGSEQLGVKNIALSIAHGTHQTVALAILED
jgi:holo-[acyl-carrier protein] synthase